MPCCWFKIVRPQANPFMPRRITKLPLLYLSFVQCYLEPGSTYQFSHHFQRVLGKRLTRTMRASQELSDQFPGVQKVSFWLSAGKILPKKTVRVQLHNKRKQEVELFVVIPYSWTRRPKLERHQRAVSAELRSCSRSGWTSKDSSSAFSRVRSTASLV